MSPQSINPATGETFASYDEMSSQAVADAIARTADTFLQWRRLSFAARAKPMRKAAEILRAEGAQFTPSARCGDVRDRA